MFEDTIEVQQQEARWAGDDRLFVKFALEAVLNPVKSAEAGRPIYDEQEFVTIIAPGNRLASVHALMDDEYKRRFKDRYNRWKAGLAEEVSGTPLEAWGKLTVSQIAELKALNVKTVEQLANIPDNGNSLLMGFYGIKKSAQDFITASAGKAADLKLAAELESRDQEIELLKSQMAQLMAAKQVVSPTKAAAK